MDKSLLLRDVPELRFVHDTSLERGSRIIGVLNKLQNKDHGKKTPDQAPHTTGNGENAKTNSRRNKKSA